MQFTIISRICTYALLILVGLSGCSAHGTDEPNFGMAIHGGAGTINREKMTSDMEKAYRTKLEEALQAGHRILASGGTAIDAVETAIIIMEDSPLFNAGKGAVFSAAGLNEMDASIMDGRTLAAGAVAGVQNVRNPIKLARLVMDKSPHVMLAGDGAVAFGREHDIQIEPKGYFYTKRRFEALQKARQSKSDDKHGTVGAVALDQHGNLAAGTSTGGMTNKRFGRIGDSPIIGAGTYANNRTCAVSCTGHGEYFIRAAVAHDISALMEYGKMTVEQAAETVVMDKLVEMGGSGGIIAIDAKGNIAMPFNTKGMYRGHVDSSGDVSVKIYGDE